MNRPFWIGLGIGCLALVGSALVYARRPRSRPRVAVFASPARIANPTGYHPESTVGFLPKPGELSSANDYVIDPNPRKQHPVGRLVIYRFWWGDPNPADPGLPALLESDYGFMLVNEHMYGGGAPKPLYLVADGKRRLVHACHTLSELRAALLTLPRGVKLDIYDKCTTGASMGLARSTWPSIARLCRASHVRLGDGENDLHLTCTCGPG